MSSENSKFKIREYKMVRLKWLKMNIKEIIMFRDGKLDGSKSTVQVYLKNKYFIQLEFGKSDY